MNDRPITPAAGATVTQVACPPWHEPGAGDAEFGESESRTYAIPATAGAPMHVSVDGAVYPAVVGSMWGYRGEGEPYITLELGGLGLQAHSIRLRLAEAEDVALQLQALVNAGRAGGAL